MTDLEVIVSILRQHGGQASYSEIYADYEKIREISLTPVKKATIRKTIEMHSSDSANYKGKDVFYSVEGIGKGVWGLR
jgi:hypothetical protein